tara:strand:- start:4191 stop:4484 length:294 start_codon:yes stop_codon:yes gene_type:complete
MDSNLKLLDGIRTTRCWFVKEYKEKPALLEAQQFVGGYVEILQLDDCQVLINEEGLFSGLPTNIEATEILKKSGAYNISDCGVVGNAIILHGDAQWT